MVHIVGRPPRVGVGEPIRKYFSNNTNEIIYYALHDTICGRLLHCDTDVTTCGRYDTNNNVSAILHVVARTVENDDNRSICIGRQSEQHMLISIV